MKQECRVKVLCGFDPLGRHFADLPDAMLQRRMCGGLRHFVAGPTITQCLHGSNRYALGGTQRRGIAAGANRALAIAAQMLLQAAVTGSEETRNERHRTQTGPVAG